jgi:lipoprotein-anchoring transpeptidase ErfK/SrfK
MSTQPLNPNDRLRLGIEAARTGKEIEARSHLIAVLKQDPNNIPAMLWLAFVLPSPQDTIRLLKRVLALDPHNERAKSGIRWARVRLGLSPEEAEAGDNTGQTTSKSSSSTSTEEAGEESIRSILLSEEVQQQAKKGALAHRARRTINPFIGIVLITGAVGLMAIGLGTLVFVPSETLAALIPAPLSYRSTELDIAVMTGVDTPTRVIEVPSKPGSKGFISLADFIDPQKVRQATPSDLTSPNVEQSRTQQAEAASTSDSEAPGDVALPSAQVDAVFIDPLQLIGPVGPFPPEDIASSVAGQLQLAHQPAYPGEKWIEVNVTTQRVIAWEGDKPVMSFVASTGLPNTPTVLGTFNIYWKLKSTLMVGPNYYLPEVPYTMYFYGGYSLHGTYWHDNFGQPMSHGCVNLKTEEAKQLFEWAGPLVPPSQTEITSTANNPGTLVVVHE